MYVTCFPASLNLWFTPPSYKVCQTPHKILGKHSLQSVLRELCYSFYKYLWLLGKVSFRSLESTTFAEEKYDQPNSAQKILLYRKQCFNRYSRFSLNQLTPLYSHHCSDRHEEKPFWNMKPAAELTPKPSSWQLLRQCRQISFSLNRISQLIW